LYLAAKAAREEVKRFVSLYLTRLRQVRCTLDGDALKALGLKVGPRFRNIMEQLLAARLNGDINSNDEERALAMALITSNNHSTVSK